MPVVWIVFLIVKLPSSFFITLESYPAGTEDSFALYSISVPFVSYLSRPLNDHAQLSVALAVVVLPSTAVPPAYSCTVMVSGLSPAASLLSDHVFVPLIDVFSVNELVKSNTKVFLSNDL